MNLSQLKCICIEKKYPIIRDDVAKYLAEFVQKNRTKEILEIGLCAGFSASNFLQNCDCHITSVEIDEDRFLEAKQNLASMGFDKSRYTLILGDACELIPKFSKKFDLIFLDGPKGQYANFLPYLVELTNIGGHLIADNVDFRGMLEGQQIDKKYHGIIKNMQDFLTKINSDSRLSTQVLHIGDGLSVSQKIAEQTF